MKIEPSIAVVCHYRESIDSHGRVGGDESSLQVATGHTTAHSPVCVSLWPSLEAEDRRRDQDRSSLVKQYNLQDDFNRNEEKDHHDRYLHYSSASLQCKLPLLRVASPMLTKRMSSRQKRKKKRGTEEGKGWLPRQNLFLGSAKELICKEYWKSTKNQLQPTHPRTAIIELVNNWKSARFLTNWHMLWICHETKWDQ